MTNDIKKGDRPTAQVYSLFHSSRATQIQKDLGPNGGDNPGNAIQDNAFESEDEFQQLYVGATRDQGIIQPPYNLRSLDRLSQENNALGPCIEAMVTNIEGTGYIFETAGEDEESADEDVQVQQLTEFFAEVWPGQSLTSLRKMLRRDLERTGNAYIEVLRNAQDEIVFLRRVDAKMMRLLRLDDAVPVAQKVTRMGKEITINVMTRERRYCQLVNGVSLMYFKEFGSKRDLHKKTAVWAPLGQRFPANGRATEILHLTVLPDSHTPYGIPRWVNQIPSVLGSRKAEEFNLDFFDNGGVPPVMIVLQGGTLQAETRSAIERMNSGSAAKNNRLQVLEVESTGGTVDSTPMAKVTVERFGGDRTSDSLFEKYDEKCELRVRRSFRLPPMFVGDSSAYTFATAFTSYVLAEAQVFKPERDAFDEMWSKRLLPAMGYTGYTIRSKPMVIEDATLKLQGVEIAMGLQQIEPADIVKAVNEIVGLHLKVSKDAQTLGAKAAMAQQISGLANTGNTVGADGKIQAINPDPVDPTKGDTKAPGSPSANGKAPGNLPKPPPPAVIGGAKEPAAPPASAAAKKSDAPATVTDLAFRALKALRKQDTVELAAMLGIVNSLDTAGRSAFEAASADLQFVDSTLDPQGLAELSACSLAIVAGTHNHNH